jgi:hypothetical protein
MMWTQINILGLGTSHQNQTSWEILEFADDGLEISGESNELQFVNLLDRAFLVFIIDIVTAGTELRIRSLVSPWASICTARSDAYGRVSKGGLLIHEDRSHYRQGRRLESQSLKKQRQRREPGKGRRLYIIIDCNEII